MAAKKARSDKGVLSRQEIASRKRNLQEQKLTTGGHGRRAIVGVFVLAAAVLAVFSLATFAAQDRVGPGFRNAVGPFGHGLAQLLYGALGVCAYLLPLAGLYTAMALFVGSRERRRWPQVVAVAILGVSTSVLAHIGFQGAPGWVYPPGGTLGASLGGTLQGIFSTVGTVILVSAVAAAALIIGTQVAFLKLCSVLWGAARAAAARLSAAFAAFVAAQREAMARRAEEAAKAKLEEQAFLARLEEDEEELAAAEREAAEAEAMAEEAHRLAKERAERELAAKRAKEEKEAARAKRLAGPAVPAVEARPLPGEPAWVSELAASAPQGSDPKLSQSEPKRKERKAPAIVTPPGASLAPAPASDAIGAISIEPLVSQKVSEQVAAGAVAAGPEGVLASSTSVAAPAAAQAVGGAASAIVPAGTAALARLPLIIEPKAPPKPTRRKENEEFEFVGDRKSFTLPPIDILDVDKKERTALDKEAFLSTAEKLRAKLADFGIVGEVVEIRPGPVVTMYEFLPGPGIKVSKIASLSDDLAMAMEAMRVRIVAPIPGKGVVGIEVPNKDRETVFLKEIAEQDAFTKAGSKLTMCLGKDIEGMPYALDLAKAPHLLIAGTTGSGKSVAVNSMIMSILLKATPEEVRFIMVDPKMLELSVYEGIPHLLLPVVTDPKKAALALRWAVEEMERRYQLLSEAGVRNISGYNKFVETTNAEKGLGKKKPEGVVKNLEPARLPVVEKAAAPPAAAAPKKPAKKMLIVDVAEGETEEAALEKVAAASDSLGVAAPREPVEDIREAVAVEPEAPAVGEPLPEPEELKADTGPVAVEAEVLPVEPVVEVKELKKLPFIVVIIDELADLMMVASREVETYVARLAQMARAAGIHLMVATQRPSTDVVTGVIKANFPTRISFMLRSKPDSMTILGTIGAEALLGMGDMLIMPPTSAHMVRVHGAYVSEVEIKRAVDHLKAQGKPVFDESILKPRDEEVEGGGEEDELSDELYDQALATVGEMRQVSISMLQRKMRIGYNRAARMIERMERDGVVGPADGAKPREVLIRAVGEMPGAAMG